MIEALIGSLSRLEARDFIEILILAFLIYNLILLIKGTSGWQITLGIGALFLFYYITHLLRLRTVEWLFANFFTYFIFAMIVIFQSEIRRGLAELGKGRLFRRFRGRAGRGRFDEVVLAATTLSSQRIGGLIVIEGAIGLKDYVESGIKLDAILTYDLLLTIFSPKTPLHDGAVIVQGNRIAAAACFLPLTLDPYLSKELGTRHRAAIGITEETDAVAVVVSEETGKISAVFEGVITRNLDGPRLLKLLQKTADSQARGLVSRAEQRRESERREQAV
jgi:diadenylate cyclase